MSFYTLVLGTQTYDTSFKMDIKPTIYLKGDYEIAIVESFLSIIRQKLGELKIETDSAIYKMQYKSNDVNLPKCFKYYEKIIKSKINFSYKENILSIICENNFYFDGIEAIKSGEKYILNIHKELNFNKQQDIYICSDIVQKSNINDKEIHLLKKLYYNGEKHFEGVNQYFKLNKRIINDISIFILNNKFEKVFFPKNHQYFVFHFRLV